MDAPNAQPSYQEPCAKAAKKECKQSVVEKYLSAEAKVKEALNNLSEIGISRRKLSDE
jgi:hypothetical protein